MDKNGYEHLSPEERAVIMLERRRGCSCRAIAALLGRAPSTVSREVARTTAVDAVTGYDVTAAALAYRDRRRHCVRRRKLQDGTRLHRMVSDWLLYWRWSPQQIAARLRRMHPEEPGLQVSHETIYATIYAHPRARSSRPWSRPCANTSRSGVAGGARPPAPGVW